jgi:cytochrome c oxidase cbb3-type subunit 2
MPGYPWLASQTVDGPTMQNHMRALAKVGVPYSEADIAGATEVVKGRTEMDALIAYLQGLGTTIK